jgi:hypothetical protein
MKPIILALSILFLINCSTNDVKNDNIIFNADRKAPLGWIELTLYKDNSFIFESRGLRDKEQFPGTYKINGDTLLLSYRDILPIGADTLMLIHKTGCSYLTKPGGLQAHINKIK